MALNIFPTSPVPAPLDRSPFWNESVVKFDSGHRQASTAYQKPLWKFGFSGANMPRTKQQSLSNFFQIQKSGVLPFLFQDPYHYQANAAVVKAVGGGVTSFYLRDVNSYPYIAKSGSLLITSTLSGALTQGSHYILDQDTGIIVASLTPASGDTWTASGQFYKKCYFTSDLSESSPVWDQFDMNVTFEEML